jgi:hypothetical protein
MALQNHRKQSMPTVKPIPPPRLRLKLATASDVKRELAAIYRLGRSGQRDVVDVSRLANVLSILGRCIETSDLERRINNLEASTNELD